MRTGLAKPQPNREGEDLTNPDYLRSKIPGFGGVSPSPMN